MTPKRALERVIEIAGGQAGLERRLDGKVKQQTISLWLKAGRCSERWAIELSKAVDFEVTPNELAPARYPNKWDGLPLEQARPLILRNGAGMS